MDKKNLCISVNLINDICKCNILLSCLGIRKLYTKVLQSIKKLSCKYENTEV